MIVPSHPYRSQPDTAFWRQSVGAIHYSEIKDLWRPIPLSKSDLIATAGSCFAQHMRASLQARGAAYLDLEPTPPIFSSSVEARRWGYELFSCRYGNIYTTRNLVQLFDEAFNARIPRERVWERSGRYYDALRPGVDPVGHENADIVLSLRAGHLSAVREMFAKLDVFIFTMGLTEGWEDLEDGTMYNVAPGTLAGNYDPGRYAFRNLRCSEVRSDLIGFCDRLRAINPGARILLTVSPVPLAATATSSHVLVATIHSKSVLRSVAGELADELDNVYYFPSYEIISSHPSRGIFFQPDLRNVSPAGVDFVMSHFFSGCIADAFSDATAGADKELPELICDEANLDLG